MPIPESAVRRAVLVAAVLSCALAAPGCSSSVELGGAHDGGAPSDSGENVDGGDPCAVCDPAAACNGGATEVICACPRGYDDPRGDGRVCIDRDECHAGASPCSDGERCENTPGGFTCACDDSSAACGALTVGPPEKLQLDATTPRAELGTSYAVDENTLVVSDRVRTLRDGRSAARLFIYERRYPERAQPWIRTGVSYLEDAMAIGTLGVAGDRIVALVESSDERGHPIRNVRVLERHAGAFTQVARLEHDAGVANVALTNDSVLCATLDGTLHEITAEGGVLALTSIERFGGTGFSSGRAFEWMDIPMSLVAAGDWAFVGFVRDDVPRVRGYERREGHWTPAGELESGLSAPFELGRELAFDGVTLAVGAPALGTSSGTPRPPGIVASYELREHAWTEVGRVRAPEPRAESASGFGAWLTVRGDQLVVNDGRVVSWFERDRTAVEGWRSRELPAITSIPPPVHFGRVALGNRELMVADPFASARAEYGGRVLLVPIRDGVPAARAAVVDGEPSVSGERLGNCVAAHGDTAVVASDQGYQAVVFTREFGAWRQADSLAVPPGDLIVSVDMDDARIVVAHRAVGAPEEAVRSGVAVYARADGGWVSETSLRFDGAPDDAHGGATTALVSGSTLLVGQLDRTLVYTREGAAWSLADEWPVSTALALEGALAAGVDVASNRIQVYERRPPGWVLASSIPVASPRELRAATFGGGHLFVSRVGDSVATSAVEVWSRGPDGTWLIDAEIGRSRSEPLGQAMAWTSVGLAIGGLSWDGTESVELWRGDGARWTRAQTIAPPFGAMRTEFGSVLAATTDGLLVGAPDATDGYVVASGAAYFYPFSRAAR